MAYINQTDIQNMLKDFRKRTNVICLSLFTRDGFLIALDQGSLSEDDYIHESIGAICAGIVDLVRHGIQSFPNAMPVKQISIKAGNQKNVDGFEIVLTSLVNDIIIFVMFPNTLNLGVILFELNNTIEKLSKYFQKVEQDEIIEHLSVSSEIS